jgi:hypothetical protein
MAEARRLTAEGQHAFKAWLEQGGPGTAPFHLLTDPATSEALAAQATVAKRSFASRLELGEYLVSALASLPAQSIRFDSGLWDWLTLFYIDELLPQGAGGRRDVREIVRYALELRNRKWSRHIVRMSWMAVKDHGIFARVMLAVAISKHTDVMEQIGGQQEAFGASAVVELADKLYFDPKAGALRRGAQGKGGGTPRRLVRFMRQFRRTYDPPGMTAQQILESLPGEFEKWVKPPRAGTSAAQEAALASGGPA